jgi:GTP cyclohydrolase I
MQGIHIGIANVTFAANARARFSRKQLRERIAIQIAKNLRNKMATSNIACAINGNAIPA